MKAYRASKEVGKLKAMIVRVERLLAGKVPRGAKGHLKAARRSLHKALQVYEAYEEKQ